MTHFKVGVLIPGEITDEIHIQSLIESFMTMYSEHLEVPTHKTECYCVNTIALAYSTDMANKLVGSWQEQRDLFRAAHPLPSFSREAVENDPAVAEQFEQTMKQRDLDWQVFSADFHQQWAETRNDYMRYHPAYLLPDPTCNQCNGSGQYDTRYNPQAKWDWFRIGGRWDGNMLGIDRDTDNGFNWGKDHEQLKFNMRPVADFISAADSGQGVLFRFSALLTPEAEWIESGQAGWWGSVSNPRDELEWAKLCLTVYRRYPDCKIVLLDAHI